MTKFSPGGIVFKALCFIFALSFFSVSVFAQQVSSQSQNQPESQNSSAQTDLNSQNQNWNWSAGDSGIEQSSPSSVGLFFRMVFALLIVLGIAYLAIRVLKRGTKLSNSDDPFLRHVSHLSLSASRSVDVVTILDHAYILGVSDNAVNLIGQIEDKELVNSMNLYADKNDNTKRPRTFNDILSIFMPNSNRNGSNENVYGSSAWNAADSLRQQRERFNESNGEGEGE